MNGENNNIIFDSNNQTLDNSTVDYNKLYNVSNQTTQNNMQQTPYQGNNTTNVNSTQFNQNSNQQVGINNQPLPIEDQIINPETTPLEQNKVNEDSEPEKKKSFIFVIIIALIIIITVMFLFPILFKKGL